MMCHICRNFTIIYYLLCDNRLKLNIIINHKPISHSAAKRNKLKLNFPMSPKTPKFTPLKDEVKMQTDEDSTTEPSRSTLESMGHPTQM